MKPFFWVLLLMFFTTCSGTVFAQGDFDAIYNEQYKTSGADKLMENVPQDAKKDLDDMGVTKVGWDSILKLTPERIFSKTIETAKEKAPSIFKSTTTMVSILLLGALFSGIKLSIGKVSVQNIWESISALFVCVTLVTPVVTTINYAANIINCAAKFMLVYIPIMACTVVASGQSLTGSSYSFIMLTMSEVTAQISSTFLVPLLNILLAISVVSSLCPRFNLTNICTFFSKTIKWIFGVSMTIFTGLLTVQSIVSTAADSIGTKTVKFMLSGGVPIVGSALSDAFLTVQGCVKLLKSGIGAFFILAVGVIFLPAMVQCTLWLFSVNICSSVGEILGVNQTVNLLKGIKEVISTVLVITLCFVMVLIVSTVIVMTINSGGTT